ncbi:hypothetical protein [Flammeovirga kamogawensis]|uniref:Uncharacterized protein n=1 Tax=Flammeovirga kamogawensis TaxID=373891 RepID=A0ABX8GYP1_9BACT|nr:hypothetical protein [Flammeovirga kamogawensis]MBB6458872.1 hypothetical protein [Flammeovirga kamogawensis]QWG08453.1 hypothetical protein KM029_05820 [Flammeovirga kamogawensis]TRX66749.1 hypothetical protein EO216_00875 [Flammeovirga kamogawensis]
MTTQSKLTIIKFSPLFGINLNYSEKSTTDNDFIIQPFKGTEIILDRLGVDYQSINNTFRSSFFTDDIERIKYTIQEMDDFSLYFSVSYVDIASYYLGDFPLPAMDERFFVYEAAYSKNKQDIFFQKEFKLSAKKDIFDEIGIASFPKSMKSKNSMFGIVKLSKESVLECIIQLEKSEKPWLLDFRVNERQLHCKYVLLDKAPTMCRIIDAEGNVHFHASSTTEDDGSIAFLSKEKMVATPLSFKGKSFRLEVKEKKGWKAIKTGLPSPSTKNLRFEKNTNTPYWLVYI